MFVGILQMTLMIRDSRSLKDKRRIIRSFKEKTKQKFNLSIAEVGGGDSWQRCDLGAALVANDSQFVNSALSKVVNFTQRFRQIELVDYQIEII